MIVYLERQETEIVKSMCLERDWLGSDLSFATFALWVLPEIGYISMPQYAMCK